MNINELIAEICFGTSICLAILSLVFFNLYRNEKLNYLRLLSFAWFFLSLRFLIAAIGYSFGIKELWETANPVFSTLSSLLILNALKDYFNKKLSIYWSVLTFVLILWTFTSPFLNFSFSIRNIPPFFFSALVYFFSGFAVIKNIKMKTSGSYLTGVCLILWGVHKITIPFTFDNAESALEGYIISSSFSFLTGLGTLLYFYSKSKQLSERIEKALRNSEKRFKDLFERAPLSYQSLDIDGNFLEVNETFIETFGYERQEVIGNNITMLLDENSIITLKQTFPKLIETGLINNVEFLMHKKNGERIYILLNGRIGYNDDGSFKQTHCILQNISDQKLVELELEKYRKNLEDIVEEQTLELRVSETRFRKITESTNDIIFECNNNNDIIYANNSFEKIAGSNNDNITGNNLSDIKIFKNGSSKIFTEIEAIKNEKQKRTIELKHSENIWVEYQIIPEFDSHLELESYIAYGRDVTNRKKIEENIKRSLEKEHEVNEMKSRFISLASHEFRTPLTTILSSSDLIDMFYTKWNQEKIQTHIKKIQSAVSEMTSLLDDVLTIGRTDEGKFIINLEDLNLKRFAFDICENFRLLASDKHCFNFKYNCSLEVYSLDKKILNYILRNVLSNAVKYSPQGGIIEFSINADSQFISFEVTDQGIGIPALEIKNLFESFYRGSNVGSINGTGLGLSIVKIMTEMHKGAIEIESKPGTGTSIKIKIPISTYSKN